MENCDIFAEVDFGHGPVEIRCTKTGEHTDHACFVTIEIPDASSGITSIVNHHNVFDDNG